MSNQIESKFDDLVDSLATNSHGNSDIFEISKFMEENFKKSKKRHEFLKPKLSREFILWEDAKNSVWKTEKEQLDNKFPFLQGDVINTTMVLALGIAESEQDHSVWMVLARDCDCIRAEYIQVAPIFLVKPGTNEYDERKKYYNYALKFKSNWYFPIPTDCFENQDIEGAFVDFTVPYYIKKEHKNLATGICSLSKCGWHILNSVIQIASTQANIDEGETLRDS